jgi:cell division ATPase FtsA
MQARPILVLFTIDSGATRS